MGVKNCKFCQGHGFLVVVEVQIGEDEIKCFPRNFMNAKGKILPEHVADAEEFTNFCGGKNFRKGKVSAFQGIIAAIGCWHCAGRGHEPE